MTQVKPGPAVADTAILLATQRAMPATEGGLGIPLMLLPLQGRCFLQRAVELLVRAGCSRIHVAIGENAEAVRDLLQSGERWGVRLDYHYLGTDEPLERFSFRLGLDPDHAYWLADATRLPSDALPAAGGADASPAASQPLCWNDMPGWRWTGWGHFSGAWLMTCRYPLEQPETEQCVLRGSQLLRHQVARPLSVASLAGLLDSNRRLLAGRQSLPNAVGRGTEIHPSARIIAPVHIGTGVKVAAGAVIGPNVSIEDGCFIDGGSRLEDSLVLSGTYVGRELDLQGIITNGSLLANVALDTVAEISDPNLLGGSAGHVSRVPPGERLLVRVLYHALQPLRWVARWQMAGRSATGDRAVAIPAPCVGGVEPGRTHVALHLPPAPSEATSQQWKEHFCRTFHPGLRQVMLGRLQLVGPTLRSDADVRRLPAEWRRLYAGFRCGLLNDGLVQDQTTSTIDDRFAADAVACANQGDMRAGWKLLRQYLAKVVRDLFVSRTRKIHPLPQLPIRVAD
jgi:hypothetical protein